MFVLAVAAALALGALLVGCPQDDAVSGGSEELNQVLKLEELTYPAIDALDREKTVFILAFGNLEEHAGNRAKGIVPGTQLRNCPGTFYLP